ncbi:hypothetical protein RclHR1_00250033 [Rhizophagus clarus]|uniref:Uncharacterized protein n=1 Tax=Rhizophagus clarus TaxID=94130 RepID=A0A2Z6R010_9GLOM|nr:hypothetical protein RclHR1_00250033 [Rhizophagus clarus]
MGRCKSSKRITMMRKAKNSVKGIEKSNINVEDGKGVTDIIDYNLNGFTERKLKPEEDRSLLNYKIGLMNIRTKSTQKNPIDPKEEIREGIEIFIEKIKKYKSNFICFNGKDGFATFMSIVNDMAVSSKYEFGFKKDDKIDWVAENGTQRYSYYHQLVD